MKTVLILLLIVLLLLSVQKEGYRELFGFSGHTPSPEYLIDDSMKNIKEYEEVPVNIDMFHLQEMILNANKYISKKIGDCTYIIETTDIKQYKHYANMGDIIRAMFMVVRHGKYDFGFAVTVEFDLQTAKVLGARTQPLSIEAPGNISAFITDGTGQEFVKTELIKERAKLNSSEFDSVKNKFA